MVWIKFLLCIVIILFAGTKTTRYADVIAEKTGLGRIWIGMLLLGIITSMPELITGISSVTLAGDQGVPDLGVGTLLGSCIFNLCVIAIIDIMNRNTPVLNFASMRHSSSALIGIIMLGIVALSTGFSDSIGKLSVGWVGVPGILIFVIYITGAWRIFTSERNFQLSLTPAFPEETAEVSPNDTVEDHEIKWLWLKFVLGAVVIVATGVWLSYVGNEIAEVTGWDSSFVGSIFLAVSTSMPELIVAISAFRIGAIDLAVADIFGANMLDVMYIFVLDVLYTKGLLLSSVSSAHTISAVIAIIMTGAILLGIRFKRERKFFRAISWYALLLIGLYITGAYVLFSMAS
ncbi:MAG: sodium:calcium antiporter [Dehalococcoidales bacterium]|nr:MAG: sodium:calcium antiporter [Dehalococcoidales bacterium]